MIICRVCIENLYDYVHIIISSVHILLLSTIVSITKQIIYNKNRKLKEALLPNSIIV